MEEIQSLFLISVNVLIAVWILSPNFDYIQQSRHLFNV